MCVNPSNSPKSRIKQNERISTLMTVIPILARFEEGAQMELTAANPNPTTGSQNVGYSKIREIPLPKAPSNIRNVISNIGGMRNEKSAATAIPR